MSLMPAQLYPYGAFKIGVGGDRLSESLEVQGYLALRAYDRLVTQERIDRSTLLFFICLSEPAGNSIHALINISFSDSEEIRVRLCPSGTYGVYEYYE